jgi:hypothetical protein
MTRGSDQRAAADELKRAHFGKPFRRSFDRASDRFEVRRVVMYERHPGD